MVIVKSLLLSAIETALKQYLALDEDAPIFLNPIAGKIIAVNIQPFDGTIYLCPTADTIQLLENCTEPPDATLTGSAIALGMMSLSSKPMDSIFSGAVTITGDIRTGRKFQELFDKLDIDLEEQVSHFTGDIIAHKLGRLLKAGKNWSVDTLDTFQLNLSEYLHDETKDLPPKPELDIFFRNVDLIRTDFDRLTVRIKRLKEKLLTIDQQQQQVNS